MNLLLVSYNSRFRVLISITLINRCNNLVVSSARLQAHPSAGSMLLLVNGVTAMKLLKSIEVQCLF